MTVFLKLGEITFANFEIPESINFGGSQALSVKQLVGGKRIVDAMGREDDDISWSGLFFESTATFRSKYLDAMRVKGTAIPLSWGQFNFLVVIKEFKPSFQRTYQIPYSITVTVVQDLNKPFPVLLPVAYNDAINNMLTEANDIATTIANPSISSAMALVSAAITNVPDIGLASPEVLNSILTPIILAQNTVTTAISALTLSAFS